MQQQIQRVLTLVLYGAAGIGALWLAARYLLPWAAPFLLALGLAALLEPAVRFLIRRGWPRGAAAGLLTLTVLGGLIWAAAALVGRCLGVVTAFARQTPSLMQGLGRSLDLLEERALAAIAAAPEGTADYLQTALDAMGEVLYDLPALLSQWALDVAGRMAAASPNVLLFAVTAGIGTYFFSAGFPSALAFLEAQIPLDWKQRLAGLGQDLKGSFSGFCRAQLILMAMTFFELLLAFLLLGIRGVVGLAAVTAVVDALPVFGTGTVLIPWALYSLLLGNEEKKPEEEEHDAAGGPPVVAQPRGRQQMQEPRDVEHDEEHREVEQDDDARRPHLVNCCRQRHRQAVRRTKDAGEEHGERTHHQQDNDSSPTPREGEQQPDMPADIREGQQR